jgi:hypothetical protein
MMLLTRRSQRSVDLAVIMEAKEAQVGQGAAGSAKRRALRSPRRHRPMK